MSKPQPEEYVPFYATYINKIGDGDIIDILTKQHTEVDALLKAIPAGKALYAYAEGKWTIKQVIGHLIDTERIMAYRLLRFARNDSSALMGFEQDDYITHSHFNEMDMHDLIDELFYIRKANLYLFKSLNAEEKTRGGLANGNPVTVNALLYIIAGHIDHHIQILKERYL
jgi:hypothetical protein